MQTILWIWIGFLVALAILCVCAWYQYRHLVTTTKQADPNSMARAFTGVVSFHIQSLVGITLIAMLLAAISAKIISDEVGFPFVTALATGLFIFNAKDLFLKNKD